MSPPDPFFARIGEFIMKKTIVVSALALAAALASHGAEAKGCLKGAAIGGVAGHYVGGGHGLLGAAAGCLVGRHQASKRDRQAQQVQQPQPSR